MGQKKNKKCACCGEYSLPSDSEFEVCPICGWEDDDIQNNDPQFEGGANDMSLEQARKEYFRKK
ncbi:MAG: hypothetical protein LKJ45_02485 [Oscillospiraceae bacterium]|jgi:anaerobic ribonucleoside-triphosphate reductase|nr:hypothetical protein [Oscillospiraceae bacterium]